MNSGQRRRDHNFLRRSTILRSSLWPRKSKEFRGIPVAADFEVTLTPVTGETLPYGV
jgi:hypothetical protein